MANKGKTWGNYLANLVIHAAIRGVLKLPYHWRVPLMGWITSRLIAPLAGYRRRIRANLAHTCPELDKAEIRRICLAVPNNFGRTLIEIYSGDEFVARVRDLPLEGKGAEALEKAYKTGQPVVLVTGHIGNYDAARAALIAHGYQMGAIYMPMTNVYFNAHYEKAIRHIGSRLFSRDRKGLGQMLRFLKGGGMAAFQVDQYMRSGAPLRFFNKTAITALSAAEMALKYDAVLVPIYGIRADNGLDFQVVVDDPIPHSDAETMTQALNDSLEHLVRQHMGQWLWIHRRWKPAKRAVTG